MLACYQDLNRNTHECILINIKAVSGACKHVPRHERELGWFLPLCFHFTHTLSSRTNSTHTPPHKKKKKKKKYRYHSFSALNDFALSWATSQARKECTTPSKSSLMSSDDSKQIFPWHTPTEHAPLKSRPSTEWGCYFYALSNAQWGRHVRKRGGG